MPNTIKLKLSSTPGVVPLAANLILGELAVNAADGTLFTKNTVGTVIQLNSPLSSTVPLADALTGLAGTGTSVARSDHVHPLIRTINLTDASPAFTISQSNTGPAFIINLGGSNSSSSGFSLSNTSNNLGSCIAITNQGGGIGIRVDNLNTSAGGVAAFLNTDSISSVIVCGGSGSGYAMTSANRSGLDSTNARAINVGRIDMLSTTLLSTLRAGALEYNGTDLYFTKAGPTRVNLSSPSGGSGGLGGYNLVTTTGTFTIPAGVTKMKVTVIGGGGGGGAGGSSAGGGGGGGGTAITFLSSLTAGNTITVTIGNGGGAGAAGAASSISSGTQTITTVTANGGDAGGGGNASDAGNSGAGGTASGGITNISGSAGGNTQVGSTRVGGVGGSSTLGGGGRGGYTPSGGGNTPALAGSLYGGGGGGGNASNGGAAGAQGCVIFEY